MPPHRSLATDAASAVWMDDVARYIGNLGISAAFVLWFGCVRGRGSGTELATAAREARSEECVDLWHTGRSACMGRFWLAVAIWIWRVHQRIAQQ